MEGELGNVKQSAGMLGKKKKTSQNAAKDDDHPEKQISAGALQCCSGDQGFLCSPKKKRRLVEGQLAVIPIKKGKETKRHTRRVSVDCLKIKPILLPTGSLYQLAVLTPVVTISLAT